MFQNFYLNNSIKEKNGYVFLDVLLAVVIISLVFVALLEAGSAASNFFGLEQKALQSDALIREEVEALRAYRDGTAWNSGLGIVSTGSSHPYYLVLDNSTNPPKWNLVQGTETVGAFTRKIIFESVSRDPVTHDILANYDAGNRDINTIKITAITSSGNRSWQVVTYLTNWQR
jgi:hypothetical protein